MKRHQTIVILCLVIGLPIIMAALFFFVPDARHDAGSAHRMVQSATPFPTDFTLVNHRGEPVTRESYSDKHLLVFFGFTYCPDVCPAELAITSKALTMLGADQLAKVQPLFISIDPERDTPAQMAQYVSLFHPKLEGLTGTQEQIDQVVKDFKVYAAKRPAADGDPESYMMDHSAYTYVIAPDGALIDILSHRATATDRLKLLRQVLTAS